MRVVGGKYKGRRFDPPKKFPSRPTTDFAKEAFFNILESKYYIEDLEVLDLFAGTGNISLEFISRGAKRVLSVDKHPVCFNYILKTIEELQEPGWRCVKRDVKAFCEQPVEQFDLIFADPPFSMKEIEQLPDLILNSGLLREDGVLIIEHGQEYTPDRTHLTDTRNYGGVNFSFFEQPKNSA